MSIFDAIITLKVGQEVLNQVKDEMNKHKFNYKDFQTLQNNYEKLIWDLCQQAFLKGKENMDDKLFMEWLKEQSCYEEKNEKKN
jgi:type III secretory pathway component EscR